MGVHMAKLHELCTLAREQDVQCSSARAKQILILNEARLKLLGVFSEQERVADPTHGLLSSPAAKGIQEYCRKTKVCCGHMMTVLGTGILDAYCRVERVGAGDLWTRRSMTRRWSRKLQLFEDSVHDWVSVN